MPSVQTYIREEDYGRYLSIKTSPEGWAEFIHNALVGVPNDFDLRKTYTEAVTEKVDKSPVLNIPGVVRGADFVPKPPDPETGYPCCVKRSPCKHWQWSSEREVYVNILTGKEREPN